MPDEISGVKKKYKIRLDVDVNAILTGFGSAKAPTAAHHHLAKNYSSVLFLGPPRNDTLLELMTHIFTEEEADAAQHLPAFRPRTAAQVARLRGRPPGEIAAVLDNLADNKHVIVAWGEPRKYTILPIVPGTFEMALVTTDLSNRNQWHKKFAELFEKVWDSGYISDYGGSGPPLVRYLPVPGAGEALNTAWPSDKLDLVLDPYDTFAVGHCQCRVAMALVGKGCGKPTDTCLTMGPAAEFMMERGLMRRVDRAEALAIKRNAEESGCVTWMMNGAHDRRGNVSCSCCGCCCHALRTINQFSAPSLFSRPRFKPHRDQAACNTCGQCAAACPMGAWKKTGDSMSYDENRCIGCGLCAVSCRPGAIEMRPAPGALRPEKDYGGLLLKNIPSFTAGVFKLWLKRTTGI